MIFTSPTPFSEAIRSNRVRQILPVSEETGSREIAKLDRAIRNQSVFSARTRHESHLSKIQEMVDKLLGPPEDPLQRVSIQDARQELRRSLDAVGYDPSQIGATPEGTPVYCSVEALAADGILIVGVGAAFFALIEIEKQIRLGLRQ
jgi:hypothetical protein